MNQENTETSTRLEPMVVQHYADDILVHVPLRFQPWMQAHTANSSLAESLHYLSRLGHECMPFANKVRQYAENRDLDLGTRDGQVSLRSYEGILGAFASKLSHQEALLIEKARASFLQSLDRLPPSEKRAASRCNMTSYCYPAVPTLPEGAASCPGDVDVNRYWTCDGGLTGYSGAADDLIKQNAHIKPAAKIDVAIANQRYRRLVSMCCSPAIEV